jgi:hypothetical protein
MYAEAKKRIHLLMLRHLGLRIDEPRAEGPGNSTTGNVCRRAFKNPKILSEIFGISEELIIRFRTILITINCNHTVHPKKFNNYCEETYLIFLKTYGSWFKIPATVHKILAHGGEIILNSPVPVGALGEEALECRNKITKKDRLQHARKCSREENLFDVFTRAMNSSDPIISTLSLSTRSKNNTYILPKEVTDLLVLEEVDFNTSNDKKDDDTSDEDSDIDRFNENFNIDVEIDDD